MNNFECSLGITINILLFNPIAQKELALMGSWRSKGLVKVGRPRALPDPGYQIVSTRSWLPDPGCHILATGSGKPDPGYQILAV